LAWHALGLTHISDPDLRGTIKELAQLDGAFVTPKREPPRVVIWTHLWSGSICRWGFGADTSRALTRANSGETVDLPNQGSSFCGFAAAAAEAAGT
jgi:hypothetical protein